MLFKAARRETLIAESPTEFIEAVRFAAKRFGSLEREEPQAHRGEGIQIVIWALYSESLLSSTANGRKQ